MATPNDIYNEITRIDNAKQGIAEAIEEKGVQVPDGTPIQDLPGKVRQIQTGSPYAVLYTPQDLTPEQQEQARENIGAYTKPGTGIPAADLAEPVQQELAKAATAYQKPGTGIPKTDLANGVQTSLEKADTALQPAALTPITELIPAQATPQNQLADKNFVNSSVATNTANYISDNGQPFQSFADLQAYSGTLTNNDYAFVVGTDSAGNTTYTRYKYNATTGEWAEEYVLNNSSFTAEQWAAISSGITALLVQKLSELPTEIVTYVAQTLTEAQKQQARTNIGATAPEIFIATVGVSTEQDINTALEAGKVVFCSSTLLRILPYVGQNSSFIFFSGIYSSSVWVYQLRKSDNTWTFQSTSYQTLANITDDIPGNRESTIKYPSTKGVFDALGKWGVVSQTQTWTRQGNSTIGYTWSYTLSNIVNGIIPQSSIDLFAQVGATFNETTGYFELNGLVDISYNEMCFMYSRPVLLNSTYLPTSNNDIGNLARYSGSEIRTNTISFDTSLRAPGTIIRNFAACYILFHSAKIEVINLQQRFPSGTHFRFAGGQIFYLCERLKKIIGAVIITSPVAIFYRCFNLEDVQVAELDLNLNMGECSHLSLESVVYMVANATNTTAITITLHATAYARCQADTTEYTYDGQTYTGIIAYATAKNITIASA